MADIRILQWNANGLLRRREELQYTLDLNKIDIGLISETHFTKQSFVKFNGYKVYHAIHPDNCAKGGSAVIIKEGICHNEEEKYETEEIQAAVVTIKSKH